MLQKIDLYLMSRAAPAHLGKLGTFLYEFWFFGLKEARACLFAGIFFFSMWVVPKAGIYGLPRYDALLLIALIVQFWMVWSKLETTDELKAICIFHAVGFALEAFKVSANIKSWTYPDFAYTKLWGVPLFSGFMYAAVGSYIIQAWRLFDLEIKHHPLHWMSTTVAVLIYLNFFTHHFIGDYRWYLVAFMLGLYARTVVTFKPTGRVRQMPLLLSFVLIGFFIWIAENMGTFFGVWRYPNQMGAWATVSLGKWTSWSLLVVMTFTIVANLRHIKSKIHISK
jgi:uncharacterized membrane protein YoaT (DUF817 family)